MSSSETSGVLIEASNLHKTYDDGTRKLEILRGTSFTVNRGEIISIVGASGTGKSTLLHLLGALDKPNQGTVTLNGRELGKLNSNELAETRAKSIGFIFQFHHLLAEFSALENVIIPGLILQRALPELQKAATERLASLGLGDRVHHRPGKMSGGEQQRVALARAMINQPDLILADEPTGNLDTQTAATVIDLLWNNARDHSRAVVIVTHDQDIAKKADRCLRLRDGLLHQEH
jgi:lipoprotein-releasing system ATP-binding protein